MTHRFRGAIIVELQGSNAALVKAMFNNIYEAACARVSQGQDGLRIVSYSLGRTYEYDDDHSYDSDFTEESNP